MRPLACLLLLPLSLLAEGAQGWYQHNLWVRLDERWSVGNYLDLRVDDGLRETHTWIASPRVRYDLHPDLQLQFNVSFLEAVNADETARPDWLRLEFEVNPTFRLAEGWTLSFRDRLEWRWRDGGDDYGFRIRVRPQLDWTLRTQGLFRGLYASNEVFYDFDRNRCTENRLIPLGVTLRPSDRVELRLFYLWRTTLGAQRWQNYHVLGALVAMNY